MKKNIVVLTGAGMSAESGIKTFRDEDGLWEGYDVQVVASPDGWKNNKALVLDFYNQRRKQMNSVEPNKAHFAIPKLELSFDVSVVTQNVDNLHERAGSSNVIHLHGELCKVRSTRDSALVYHWEGDLNEGDVCDTGYQLRPHIVWFGEMVPMLEIAIREVQKADIAIIIGTSMQVYPAASLISYARNDCEIFYVDPKPHINHELMLRPNLNVIPEKATQGVTKLVEDLMARD